MLTGDLQFHMGIDLPVDHHIEHRAAVEEGHVVRHAVRRPILHGEGEHRVLQSLHGVPRAGVVGIGDDVAPLGYQIGKGMEGVLDIRQILEKVQMVLLHVKDHRHRGEEVQEGVAVLAGLQNDGVPLPHPIAGVQQRQRAADHHRGISSGLHEDVGGHGGGGGLAVGTGKAHGICVFLHDGAPGLRPLIYGDAPCDGPGDLRVLVVDGGGADHQIAVLEILRRVADGPVDAQ